MKKPKCKCGDACAYYGLMGGFSIRCVKCNAKAAARQRENRRIRKGIHPPRVRQPTMAPSRWAAWQRVCRAVKSGILQRPSTLSCADCGAQARVYDHRDYNKPLSVVPVCVSCNLLRGAAVPIGTYSGKARRNGSA